MLKQLYNNIFSKKKKVDVNKEEEEGGYGTTDQILEKIVNNIQILEKFEGFKKFDSTEDYSDHYYKNHGGNTNKPLSKQLTKSIAKEWKILENNLPDTIYVRIYESKIDIMRAAIIGAKGTPYESGIFFFDIFFPESYPNIPPLVHYHSHGLRINPNLYANGKVCLSILNTWRASSPSEKWKPGGKSTILQVLLSIQALVLNAKPLYNEPIDQAPLLIQILLCFYIKNREFHSLFYNEHVFILNLKTMMYTMKVPPRNFKDLVMGHFCKNGSDIIAKCEAYRNIGRGPKNQNQDGVLMTNRCSEVFRKNLRIQMKFLVKVFVEVGLLGTSSL